MDIQKLIENYTQWLKSEITFEKIGEYYEITTPFLDNANDYLQIYVKLDNDEIIITDDGAIINGLKMNGLKLTQNRKEHLDKILFQYGVKLDGDALVSKTSLSDFSRQKHMFIQAMLKADDMLNMTTAKVASYFVDDVQSFFERNNIFCTENAKFTGVSGFTHNYDFVFQRNRTKPERFCSTVNNPNKSNMSNILFSLNDIKPVRKPDSQLIVILNDKNSIGKGVKDAFVNYGAKVIPWSEIDKPQNLDLLSAS